MLIVGAGPAGLACAIRLGQLLEESPETAERLGDVPVAVVEKGAKPGSHLLSGAVVNPRALRRLFRGRLTMDEIPSYGEVHGEARLPPDEEHGRCASRRRRRCATTATGSSRCRSSGGSSPSRRRRPGAAILPETAATAAARRRRARARHSHRRPRTRPRRPGARRFRAGLGRRRAADRARRGHAGPPDRRGDLALRPRGRAAADLGARRQGGLEGAEAARPHRPHAWAGRCASARSTASSAARSSTRWATTWSRSASSPGSSTATSSSPCTTCCRSSRRTASCGKILRGGERIAWGAKTITEGGYHALPTRFHAPGLLLAGESAGLVNVPTLKGIHYAIESGMLAAETAFRGAPARRVAGSRRRARAVRRGAARELRDQGPARGAEHAPGLRQGLLHGRRARERDDRHEGQAPAEGVPRAEPNARALPHPGGPRAELSGSGRQAHVRQALVGLPLREPHARRPAEPHPHPAARAARPRRDVGAHVPGAGVRGGRGRRRRHRHGRAESVELRPVRCDHAPRAAGSRRPRAAPGPSTRSPSVDARSRRRSCSPGLPTDAPPAAASGHARTSRPVHRPCRRHARRATVWLEGRALPEDGLVQGARRPNKLASLSPAGAERAA